MEGADVHPGYRAPIEPPEVLLLLVLAFLKAEDREIFSLCCTKWSAIARKYRVRVDNISHEVWSERDSFDWCYISESLRCRATLDSLFSKVRLCSRTSQGLSSLILGRSDLSSANLSFCNDHWIVLIDSSRTRYQVWAKSATKWIDQGYQWLPKADRFGLEGSVFFSVVNHPNAHAILYYWDLCQHYLEKKMKCVLLPMIEVVGSMQINEDYFYCSSSIKRGRSLIWRFSLRISKNDIIYSTTSTIFAFRVWMDELLYLVEENQNFSFSLPIVTIRSMHPSLLLFEEPMREAVHPLNIRNIAQTGRNANFFLEIGYAVQLWKLNVTFGASRQINQKSQAKSKKKKL